MEHRKYGQTGIRMNLPVTVPDSAHIATDPISPTDMVVNKQTFTIAGLSVDVFSDPTSACSSAPIAAFFLLHGRLSSSRSVQSIAESLVRLTRQTTRTSDSQSSRQDLIVITFVCFYYNSPALQPHIHSTHRITETMVHDCQILRRIIAGAMMVKQIMDVMRKYLKEVFNSQSSK